MNRRVLVLDAAQRSALAVVRSLGRHPNITVVTADCVPEALAGHSKYSSHYDRHPPASEAPQAFIEWLGNFIREQSIDLVFPVTEVTGQLIQLRRDELPDCVVPLPSIDTLLSLADKGRLLQLADEAGIPYPATRHYSNASEVELCNIHQFPVVLKPCRSHFWLGDRWLSTSVQIARDSQALERLLRKNPWLREHPFLLQEFIPGRGAGVFTLCDNGEPLVFFAHQRLREKPPSGGISVFSRSVAADPDLIVHTERLMRTSDWSGVAMVEFRVTPEGAPFLMEVNTRFWGSLQLAIDAGVDFPYLLYQLYTGQRPDVPQSYREDQRLRWLLGDLDHLYLRLKDGEPLGAKLGAIGRFLQPNARTRHEVNRWDDLGPAWYELQRYLRRN